MSGGESHRIAEGGVIDRSRPLAFSFAGQSYSGFAGDTLASALLANGVRLIGRSFKYHRPRGLLGAGVEEPNALVRVGTGAQATPNVRATEVELSDGLVAEPVNCWPSLRFDVGAVNGLGSPFLAAGFYYKTFMWPDWHLYEWAIRRAAGLGKAPSEADPDRYETRYAHCDVLIVGGGAAGLAAARAAAASDARVMLVEQDSMLGGLLQWTDARVDGMTAGDWARKVAMEIANRSEARILTRTTAVGYFDHNEVVLLERTGDSFGAAAGERVRFRLWQVRAKRVVLATGATERPLVFAGNDRPGVMLSSAVREYLRRYAVKPGEQAVVFTNNDDAYLTAHDLAKAGARVTLLDTRRRLPVMRVDALRALNVEVVSSARIVATKGRSRLRAVEVRDAAGHVRSIGCDVLAMSGGFNPNLQLFRQSGGKVAFDEQAACFKPAQSVQAEQSVGAAAGVFDLGPTLTQAHGAGATAAGATPSAPPQAAPENPGAPIEACWLVEGGRGKAFVDFQNDVTADDIALAARENFVSVEHLKRYTTLGMAPDQGKTSNVNAIAILAGLTGRDIAGTGATADRFPFTPVSFGALAGRARGELFRPLRRMPVHDWHATHCAVFEEYGGWLRPAYYRHAGETAHHAEQREARAVRERVGLFEGSPLGKIDVKGPDAATFLDRIYANTMSTLKPGRLRYGLMLNELGVAIDDGVTARFADDHFMVGTTGAGAQRMAAWLEEWLQCEWLDLEVITAPVTSDWAVITIAGPQARAVISATGADVPMSPVDFPHMSFRVGHVAGVSARIFRVSFTGELSYEINVPARRGREVWEALMRAGAAYGIEPVGIDAWMLLRTEKGYLHIGADTDGTTSADDIGWGHVLKRTVDFVGKRSLLRPDNRREDRHQFVGLEAVDGKAVLPIGAHLCKAGLSESEGYVTSSGFSPVLGRGVALGMVRAGRARLGEVLEVVGENGKRCSARIVAPCAYDVKGERLHA